MRLYRSRSVSVILSALLLAGCKTTGMDAAYARKEPVPSPVFLIESLDQDGKVNPDRAERRDDERDIRVVQIDEHENMLRGALVGAVPGAILGFLSGRTAMAGALAGASAGAFVPRVSRWAVRSVPQGGSVTIRGKPIDEKTEVRLLNVKYADLPHLLVSMPGHEDCRYGMAGATIAEEEIQGMAYNVFTCVLAPRPSP